MAERQRTDAGMFGFLIATLLIGGFLVIIGVPAVRGQVDIATQLAAIFSGWIAAIIGFYFIQGQARQAAAAGQQAGIGQGESAVQTAKSVVEVYETRIAALMGLIEQLGQAPGTAGRATE